jgi:Domain of unknown function (DUF4157)
MRTFAQQPKAAKRTVAAEPAAPDYTRAGRSRTESWIFQLQRTLGNRAVESLLRENRGEAPADSSATTRAREAEPAAMDGAQLPSSVRAMMEARFGEALDDVRLHDGPAAHRLARALGARAFTTGSDVVLGDQISTSEVQDPRSRLLTHELTHVLQHRRAGNRGTTDRIVPTGGAAEREAGRNGVLNSHGLPVGAVQTAIGAVALTPTSDAVEYDLSYAADDWAVTAAEEKMILDALDRDSDLSATITDLRAAGMLGALFDRVDEPGNRLRLLHILGRGLNATARALVEPYVRGLGTGAELQLNLGRLGVTSAAPAFNPTPLESAVVGTARTSRTGHTGGHLSQPFTGVGATGIIPTTRYVGTFYTTPGVPAIPALDKLLLAAGDEPTREKYKNPVTYGSSAVGTAAYLGSLTTTQRTQQAELLLRRPIASVESGSYQGKLPSRAQVITAAARAHNLHGALVAAFILAEQRDQSQAEDAGDYQGATSIMRGDTSIGLGQVVVSTARSRDLFADLVSDPTRRRYGLNRSSGLGQEATARLLASDEYNIFAVARYIRKVADQGATKSLSSLPNTAASFPGIVLAAYAGNSSTWPDDNIRAIGSEYTSKAWDDRLVLDWAEFVFQAYRDVVATGVL